MKTNRGMLIAADFRLPGGGERLDLDAVERAYRRYAHVYDFCFGAILQPGRKAIVERMACAPGERILEVGFGTGLPLPYPRNVSVTGIDVSRDMLCRAKARKAREGLDNIEELLEMDAGRMSFRDNSFDRVVAMHVASSVPRPERMVEEMRRVCKPNGVMVFVNHFHSRNPLFSGIEQLLSPLSGVIGFRPGFSLERFLEETGMVAMRTTPVNLFHCATVVEVRNNKRFPARTLSLVGN